MHIYSKANPLTFFTTGCSNSSILAGVEQMNRFRQFMLGTDGESAFLFWLEVQHLLHLLHSGQIRDRDMARFIDRIRSNFINDDAPFCLNREIRMKLSTEFCSLNLRKVNQWPVSTTASLSEHGLSTTHSRYLQAIVQAQAQVISILKGYWYNKFVCIEKTKSDLGPNPPSNMKCSKDTFTMHRCLPDIVTDEGQSAHKVATEQLHVKLPDIDVENSGCCSIKRAERVKQPLAKSSQVVPLFSPSMAELFPHTDMPPKFMPKAPKHDFLHFDPFLSAGLRADFLAGHPFLTYLSNSELHKKAVNVLLFWQSAEVMFMEDEMRRFQQPRKGRKQERDRECPYVSYTDEIYPTAKNPAELVQLYLRKGSPHMIELPSNTREELILLLPKGLGQSLLISVQELAAQVRESVYV